MQPSVIISTYNQPRFLELVLTGFSCQSHHDFEVVIADDGSGPETEEVIQRAQEDLELQVVHVWHPDRGFRKTEILNRALLAAGGDYLIFTDGDCIPRGDFVERHVQEAGKHRFLSGGHLPLPERLSSRLSAEDVRSGRLFDPGWLRKEGWRSGKRVFRLTRDLRLASMLDRLTPTGATWNGGNASTWKEALVRANGFDLDMGYGGEDRAAG
jgi:glycosyltransferase involved in cell wall biosynthesis